MLLKTMFCCAVAGVIWAQDPLPPGPNPNSQYRLGPIPCRKTVCRKARSAGRIICPASLPRHAAHILGLRSGAI